MKSREKVLDDMLAGRWFPSYYGNRYKVSRLVPSSLDEGGSAPKILGQPSLQVNSDEIFDTLKQSQAECKRRNAG